MLMLSRCISFNLFRWYQYAQPAHMHTVYFYIYNFILHLDSVASIGPDTYTHIESVENAIRL